MLIKSINNGKGGSDSTFVTAASQEEENAALVGAAEGSWLVVVRTDGSSSTGNQSRSIATAMNGVYVGTSAPTLISFAEWLDGGTGYWSWIDISSGTTTATVAATIAPSRASGGTSPLDASFTRYISEAVTPAQASGEAVALDAPFTQYVAAIISPAGAAGSISALIASTTVDGQVSADLAAAQATGMAQALSVAYTQYVTAVLGAGTATGTAQALTAAHTRYVAAALGASAGAGSVTPLVASFTALSVPSAPTGTSSVAGDGLITMHPGTSTGATSYNYYIRASADPTTSTYDFTGTVTDGQTKAGLTNGTAYHIGYTAVNSSGESVLSTIDTVTPVAAPTLALATSGLINFTDWASGTIAAPWSTSFGSPSIASVGGNNKLLPGQATTGAVIQSFTAVSGFHLLAKVRSIGTSTSTEGANLSAIVVAPNGTDYYRFYFATMQSSGAPMIGEDGEDVANYAAAPIGASDNTDHDFEAIITPGGLVALYLDGALLSSAGNALSTFSSLKLTGASNLGGSSNGGYWDDVTVCKSKNVTVAGSGILAGYKLRIGGSGGKLSGAAGSNGAALTVDMSGIRTRQSLVEILNGSNVLVGTLTDTNNVYPGNTYTYQ